MKCNIKSVFSFFISSYLFIIVSLSLIAFSACSKDEEKTTPSSTQDSESSESSGDGTQQYNAGKAVDLGLSVKWADMNVGASKPEDYGDYFAWGETKPKTTYNWSTYKWCEGSDDTMTKYCTNSSRGTVDDKTVLELSDDAARANWGGSWRMPTYAELNELKTKCTFTWTTQNGVEGVLVTGPNGNRIFLPATGVGYGSYDEGFHGRYWSSKLHTGNSEFAHFIRFDFDYGTDRGVYYNMDFDDRDVGRSVRPVTE